MKIWNTAFLLCLFPAGLLAQQFPAKTIVFSGYPQASKAELLATAELKEGSSLTEKEIQAAAQRLNDTGMFSNIGFEFNNQILKVTLQPAESYLPAHFQNFPWWDEKTIADQVHNRVPLFHGVLPPVAGLKERVESALTAMVSEQQHIDAKIHGEMTADQSGKPTAIEFRVEYPRVVIGEIALVGVSPELKTKIEADTKQLTGQSYLGQRTQAEFESALRKSYRNQGYVDATVACVASQQPVFDGKQVSVPLQFKVSEGAQYKIGALKLDGDVLMKAADFEKLAALHPGDIASEERLKKTIAIVGSPYQVQGYLRAKITATPTIHSDQKTIDYLIRVIPGEVFHMGTVRFENLTEEQQAQVLKAWKLAKGDPYDASYPMLFLKKNGGALHSLDGYSATYTQRVDEESHIVDLILTFHKGGPLS